MHLTMKIAMIGDPYVGKTSIIHRYINGSFNSEYISTFGVDFVGKTISHKELNILGNSDKVSLTIWDLAGQTDFLHLTSYYLSGAVGVFIVFDMSRPETFDHVKNWKLLCDQHSPAATIMLVGNKIDLKSRLNLPELNSLAKSQRLKIWPTSAKENTNIGTTFEELIKIIIKRQFPQIKSPIPSF